MTNAQELKLPIQYLMDNGSSTPEMCALLISGPLSFRHRYDFLKSAGNCVSFVADDELVYCQTNIAIDSRTTNRVLMRFYSSPDVIDHEREAMLQLQSAVRLWRGMFVQESHDELLRLQCKELSAEDPRAKAFAMTIYDEFDDAKRRVIVRDASSGPESQTG